jgi:hypothetical protein
MTDNEKEERATQRRAPRTRRGAEWRAGALTRLHRVGSAVLQRAGGVGDVMTML